MEAGRVGEGQAKTFLRKEGGRENAVLRLPWVGDDPFEDRSVKKTLTPGGPLMEAATVMERLRGSLSK
jgi:hypothetical protein